jgi:hypothetical protein
MTDRRQSRDIAASLIVRMFQSFPSAGSIKELLRQKTLLRRCDELWRFVAGFRLLVV